MPNTLTKNTERITSITGNIYNNRINNTTWFLMNNDTSTTLGGTDTTVGDTEDIGTLNAVDMRTLLAVIPYNMSVYAVSGSVCDDDIHLTNTNSRIGIWRLPALATAGAVPTDANPDTFTLAYITDGFGGINSKAHAFYDTSASFALTAGDGVFMAYLNPQSGGNDDVALTMSIWAHQTT